MSGRPLHHWFVDDGAINVHLAGPGSSRVGRWCGSPGIRSGTSNHVAHAVPQRQGEW